MDNTIENAQLYFDELRHTEQPVFVPITTAGIMVAYTNKITASKDQRIAELEKQVEELGGQSILDTLLRNKGLREDLVLSADAIGLLQHDNARLEKENTDLRRSISECKAKARVGLNPDK